MSNKTFNFLCFLIFIAVVTYPIPSLRIFGSPPLILLIGWLLLYNTVLIFYSVDFNCGFKIRKSKDEIILYISVFFIVVSVLITQLMQIYPNYRSVFNFLVFLFTLLLMCRQRFGTYRIEKIYRWLIFTGIVLTVYGYYGYLSQNVGIETKSDIWLNYSRYFGLHYTPSTRNGDIHFISIPLVLLFSKMFYGRKTKLKFFDFLLFLFLGTALVLSFSRGAWVAVLCSVSYLIAKKRDLKKYIKIILLIPAILTIAYLALRYFSMDSYFVGKVLSIFGSDRTWEYLSETTSNSDRKLLLINGMKLFFQNPFGVGIDSIRYYSFHTSARVPYHVENNYLNILVELGFLGFAAFLVIWGYPLYKILLKTTMSYVEAGMQGMLIYMLIVLMFNVETLNFYHWIVYSIIWMAHFNSRRIRKRREIE